MSANSIALIAVVGVVLYGALTTAVDKAIPKDPFNVEPQRDAMGKSLVGQACNENSDCSTKLITSSHPYGASGTGAIGCCNGTCQVRRQGLLGVYDCRNQNEAPENIELLARHYLYGENIKTYEYPNTKEIGKGCSKNSDCGKYGMPHNAPSDGSQCGCYKGQCTFKKRDYAGNLFWPDECKASIFSPPGTCNDVSQRTESENKYREWFRTGKIDNPGLQPYYEPPKMTREEIENYFK